MHEAAPNIFRIEDWMNAPPFEFGGRGFSIFEGLSVDCPGTPIS
jgi:hypothetical protein